MRYRPFTNRHTKHIVQTIKENIEFCNIDQITIDTLDICHLIGRIEQLEDKNYKLRIKNKKSNKRIDDAIEYIKTHNVIGTNKEYIPREFEYCCSLELLQKLKGDRNE